MEMLDKEWIKKEIDKLPEDILAEVFDFIQFLESKREGFSRKIFSGVVCRFFPEDLGQ
jgi:hypothetical protein